MTVWCPGCSSYVGGVCHHFHCAIGPNSLQSKVDIREKPMQTCTVALIFSCLIIAALIFLLFVDF